MTEITIQILNKEIEVADYNNLELIERLTQPSESLENFYVCDLNDIVEKHKIWTKLMPRVKPFYAVKCNNHSSVLGVLAALGTGFDCASATEIESVLRLGVDPNRIIYAHPIKLVSHIQYASSKNVTYNTFDSEVELQKCKKYYPNAKMIIRIRCDASKALVKFGDKFGCNPYEEASDLLKIARKLQLNVVGVAFHVGSGCQDVFAFRKAIQGAKFVFDCGDSLGFKFDLLDLGGGFPGNKDNCLDTFANVINEAIEDFFPNPSIRVVAEPGTYFVRSAFTLYCSIQGIKQRICVDPKTGNETTEYMYYIADGVFHSFSRVILGIEKIQPKLIKEKTDGQLHKCTVWGQTLDSNDKVMEEAYLPKVELGDWLMFENMGDYSISLSSSFNGFLSPDVFTVANQKTVSLLMTRNAQIFINSKLVQHIDK